MCCCFIYVFPRLLGVPPHETLQKNAVRLECFERTEAKHFVSMDDPSPGPAFYHPWIPMAFFGN